jgi:formate/nitrite transporter
MAQRAESLGVTKAQLASLPTFALAVLAGAFIGLGAAFYTVVSTGLFPALPYGLARLIGGFSFCLGLILVVVAGAELFTGNNLIVMAWASRKISTRALLRNWILVYLGNSVGAIATAYALVLSRMGAQAKGEVGALAIRIALHKVSLGFEQAVVLGAMCNALVCLAVWLCMSARSTTDRILAVLFPITAFVACGFEHSIANLYFVPYAIFLRSQAAEEPVFAALNGIDGLDGLEWMRFLSANLLPVTLGNVIGGAGMVGLVYWLIYCRRAASQ